MASVEMRYFLATLLVFAVFTAVSARVEAATLTRREAIARVQRDTGAKVLSAETKQVGRQIIYRIKVLTRAGSVRIIEVPADDQGNGTIGNGHRR
jgi:hypothetical protein